MRSSGAISRCGGSNTRRRLDGHTFSSERQHRAPGTVSRCLSARVRGGYFMGFGSALGFGFRPPRYRFAASRSARSASSSAEYCFGTPLAMRPRADADEFISTPLQRVFSCAQDLRPRKGLSQSSRKNRSHLRRPKDRKQELPCLRCRHYASRSKSQGVGHNWSCRASSSPIFYRSLSVSICLASPIARLIESRLAHKRLCVNRGSKIFLTIFSNTAGQRPARNEVDNG